MLENWKCVSEELLLEQCLHAVFLSATLKSKYAIVNITTFFMSVRQVKILL